MVPAQAGNIAGRRLAGAAARAGSLPVLRLDGGGTPAVERTRRTAAVGSCRRRIGSLDHAQSRVSGGFNQLPNLGWYCLWCNTRESVRRTGATDHGGHGHAACLVPRAC